MTVYIHTYTISFKNLRLRRILIPYHAYISNVHVNTIYNLSSRDAFTQVKKVGKIGECTYELQNRFYKAL